MPLTINRIFRRLKLAALGVVALGALSAPAMATNWSSCPGTVTTVASYDLTGDLITTGSTCIEVVTSNAGSLTIDCHGYKIKADIYPLKVHDNVANVSWTNCLIQHGNTGNGGYVVIQDNTGGTASYQNNYALSAPAGSSGGTIDVIDSPYAYFDYDVTSSTFIFFRGSTYYRSRYGHVHNSNLYMAGLTFQMPAGVWVASNDVTIIGNIITGDSSNQYLDDCIILDSITSGGQVASNTCSHVFDMGIEIFNQVNNITINNNDIHYYKQAGIGCYYGCDVDNVTFYANTVDHAINGYPKVMFSLNGDVYGGGGTFTNNTIDSNLDLDYSSVSAQFGYTGNTNGPWTTYSGNTFVNNDFGHSTSVVTFQSTGGVTDGGGNYCYTAAPSAITCH